MKVIDLSSLGKQRVSFYLALEEYLLISSKEEFFFLWDIGASIVIGKHQLMEAEVNMDYVKKNNLFVYRRPSGGGAIYADDGCFMFTFLNRIKNKESVFKRLELIALALNDIGLDVCFSGRNDLLFKEKKFSGNSYYQTSEGSILHGTFLYDTNIEALVKSITPNNEKLISKGIKSVKERVINLKEYLNISKQEVMNHLNNFISKEKLELTNDDLKKVLEIEKKFLNKDWLLGKEPPFIYKNKITFSYGTLEVFVDVYKGKVKTIDFKGDFFTLLELDEFLNSFKGVDFSKDAFLKKLKEIDISFYIIEAKNEDFIKLLF